MNPNKNVIKNLNIFILIILLTKVLISLFTFKNKFNPDFNIYSILGTEGKLLFHYVNSIPYKIYLFLTIIIPIYLLIKIFIIFYKSSVDSKYMYNNYPYYTYIIFQIITFTVKITMPKINVAELSKYNNIILIIQIILLILTIIPSGIIIYNRRYINSLID